MEKINWTDHVGHRVNEISTRKANWIGRILRRNCLLRQVIEGKIKGVIEVTGSRGRRRRKLLDDHTLRTGDANLRHLRFLHYNYERQMTQICLLTPLGFYALNYTIHKAYIKQSSGPNLKKVTLL
jgi:hypothetical protein